MALINCPECGKEISDKAASCPSCGCPIVHNGYRETYEEYHARKTEELQPKRNYTKWVIVVLVVIVLWVALSLSLLTDESKDTKTKKYHETLSDLNEVKMPIVVGRHIKEVTDELDGLGLIYSINREKNEKYDEGLVLECNIAIDQLVDSDTNIILTVNALDAAGADSITDTELSNTPVLTAGIYVVGEDIDAGKYNFYAKTGNGSLKIYNSFKDYKNDEYGYDAFRDFDILAEGASRGLLNGDVCTDKIMNVRLTDGQCLIIEKGLNIYYELSEKIENNILPVGVYVIGEDLDVGKYNFTAIKGTGTVKIYNSYEEYWQDEYGYNAFTEYDMREENASTGLLNEDVYSQLISNIRLENGQCLVIEDGLMLEYAVQ